jgi:Domain of unknown function (DUF6894)
VMWELIENQTLPTENAAREYADQLAEKLVRSRSATEIRGRFVRVRNEDGKEVYRTALTNRGSSKRFAH